MQTPKDLFYACGELKQDVYYKHLEAHGGRIHHVPSKHRCGDHKDLMKVCPECEARYCICKTHANSYSAMEKQVEILFSLGNSMERIINKIKTALNISKACSLAAKATPEPKAASLTPKAASPKPKAICAKSHVNYAAKSATSVHCAKTTHETKDVELAFAPTTSPENSTTEFKDPSNISEVDGSFLESLDNVMDADYEYPRNWEDYNFEELSMLYSPVFLACLIAASLMYKC